MKELWVIKNEFLKIVIKYIFSYKVRLIILLFSLIYCIILITVLYLLYVQYLEVIKNFNTQGLHSISRDISTLVSLHPLNVNQMIYNPNIDLVYNTLDITHYSDFLYLN